MKSCGLKMRGVARRAPFPATTTGPRAVLGGAPGEWLRARLVLAGLLAIACGAVAAPPTPAGQRVLEPMNYAGVSLDGGWLRAEVEETRRFYLSIPNDDLLKGFRQRAGLPGPGVDLGGWYSGDVFHVFGQILSGLARLYAGTGDAACRDKANALVTEWARCLGPDGYFYCSAKPNAPHYIYDKTVWGLLDVYLYCGNRDALTHLGRITDWAMKNLERSRRLGDTSTEWYTLSENLYRAWLATGDARFRDFAQVWEYKDYWDVYARNGDIFGPRPDGQRTGAYHAYSHVNTLGGAGAAFLAKGERRYLDILRQAYAFLQANELLATGGYGPDEQLLPREQLSDRLGVTQNTFETQCGCWAAFKMAKYLITLTGDAQYGDWVERLVWNGLAAGIPMTPEGRVFYYSDYNLGGGAKRNHDTGWTCCTGTRPQAVADLHDLVYFHDRDTVYVNLFTPSTLRWQARGVGVTLRQTTRFPEANQVEFTVNVAKPVKFGLKLRAPGWLAGPLALTVNGVPLAAQVDARHWAGVQRRWRNGDRIVVTLPMRLWTSALTASAASPTAVLYGPVALAFRGPDARWLATFDPKNLGAALAASPGEALTWHLAAAPEVLARPFYAYQEGQPYHLYLDPRMAKRIPHRAVKFQGPWLDGGRFRFCSQVGVTAECAFEGTGIRWLGYRFDDAGRAEVAIDGQVVAVVDQYGPGRDLPFDWAHRGLAGGKHTLRLRLLPEKHESSKDHFLNIAGFEAE